MSDLQTKIHLDGDKMVIQNTQDATPYFERNQALQNEGHVGSSEFRYAGSIPDIVIYDYMIKNGVEYQEFMGNPVHIKRILNDSDYSKTRIWTGRI